MSSTKKSFWNSRPNAESNNVESGKKQIKPERRRDSFQDFEAKTIDAWDDGDDDLLKMATSVNNQSATGLVHTASNSLRSGRSSIDESTKSRSSQSFQNSSTPATPSRLQGHRLGFGKPIQPLNNDVHVSKSSSSSAKTPPSALGRFVDPLFDQHDASKMEKFKSLFDAANLNLDELRTLCWSGIPLLYRPIAWKLLSGYMPTINERREIVMQRKRLEYQNLVQQYYDTRLQELHQETFRQIHIDVPRTCPLIPLFQQEFVQELFERVLYIWAIRHPASGYVQGINDLITPFFVVFLTEYIGTDDDVQQCKVAELDESCRQGLEADCFWCFSKLLDGIQDNYTFAQPGIQTRISSLQELVGRIDNGLHSHLERHNIEYLQFAFRWMNNLLMREMPLHCVIRLWDTYLAEPDGFASFHLYVCASFLTRFSVELQREKDFHGLMLLLQSLPTHQWTSKEVGLILADAYRLKFMFADAPKHYRVDSGVAGSAAAAAPVVTSSARVS